MKMHLSHRSLSQKSIGYTQRTAQQYTTRLGLWLGLILCLVMLFWPAPEMVFAGSTEGGINVHIYPPSGPDDLSDDETEDCGSGGCGDPSPGAATGDSVGGTQSCDPIELLTGSVIERETDLHIPSLTFGYSQSRSYTSSYYVSVGSEVGLVGKSWFMERSSCFLEDTNGLTSGGDIDVFFSKQHKRTFAESGGNYTAPADYNATLVARTYDESIAGAHDYDQDSVADSYTVYDLTETDNGRVYRFLSGDSAVATGYRMRLVEVTDEASLDEDPSTDNQDNSQRGTLYEYNSQGKVTGASTGGGAVVTYTLVASGSEAGRMDKIEVKPDGSTVLKMVEYTYHGEVSSPATGLGSFGDLVMVKVSDRSSASDPYRVRYTMYRYYTSSTEDPDGDSYDNGKPHQLRAVLESDAVQRLLDSGDTDVDTIEEILSASDSTDVSGNDLSDYFSRSFVYYTSNADKNTDSNITTAWGTENLSTRYGGDNLNEYNSASGLGMVKSETINGSGCGSCGGSSASGMVKQYYYMDLNGGPDQTSPIVPGIHQVVRIVVEDTLADTDGDGAADDPVYRKIYGLNLMGKQLRKAIFEDADPGTTSGYDVWCRSTILGTTGDDEDRVTEVRMPSAHTDVDSDTELKTFLNPVQYDSMTTSFVTTNDSSTLNNSAGVVYVYENNSNKRRDGVLVKEGENGTAYYVSATDWGDTSAAADTPDHLPLVMYSYPAATTTRTDSSRIATATIAYTFWDSDDTVIKTKTVTYPTITSTYNGSGVATTTASYYDRLGRLRWTKDGEGNISYLSYHPDTGGRAYEMRDVETDDLPADITTGSSGEWIAWYNEDTSSTAVPTGFTNTSDNNIQMVSKSYFDDQGRTIKYVSQTPSSADTDQITYMVYTPTQTLTFPSWDTTNNKPRLPIQVSEVNSSGVLLKRYSVDPDRTAQTAGVPTGLSAGTDQSHYVALNTFQYDTISGDMKSTRSYHDIPGSGDGTLSTNYSMTVHQNDPVGRRQYTIQTVSGTAPGSSGVEQVTKVVYQNYFMKRVLETKAGVSTASHNIGTDYDTFTGAGLTLATLSKSTYDAGGVGDGHLTKSQSFHGSGANDYTGVNYHRDFLGRMRGVEPFYNNSGTETAFGPYSVQDIRWDGQTTHTAVYTAIASWASVLSDDDYAETVTTSRRGLSKTMFDDLGRPYRVLNYTVNASTGAAGSYFQTDTFYDRNSRTVAVAPKYQAATEFAYDGLGRSYQTRTVAKLEGEDGGSGYYNSGEFRYQSPVPDPDFSNMTGVDDFVYTINHTEFTDNTTSGLDTGLPTRSYSVDMAPFADNHTTNTPATIGVDFTNDDDYVVTYAYSYYDAANRPTAVISHGSGTNGSGNNGWQYGAEPTYAFATVPAFTDTNVEAREALLTTFAYDADTGRRNLVTSATGFPTGGSSDLVLVATKTFTDDLGRTTFVSENHTDFDPANISTTIGGGTNNIQDRVTAITYDGLSNVTKQTAYNKLASSTSTQETEYLFNDPTSALRATLIKYPDGTTTTGTGQDNIQIAYHIDGSINTRTDQRGVVMTYAYTSRRQLDYMGATTIPAGVDDSVKSIGYSYDSLARVEKITSYANNDKTGTVRNEVQYEYNDLGQTTTSYQSHDGAVNTGTTPKVQYSFDLDDTSSIYADGARLATMTYPDGRVLTYGYQGTADAIYERLNRPFTLSENSSTILEAHSSPMGHDGYRKIDRTSTDVTRSPWTAASDDGYDRFGRTAQMKYSGSATLAELNYGYDAASNRVYREDALAAASSAHLDELYAQDDLSRLDSYQLGNVTTGSTPSMSGANTDYTQAWDLDPLGNWAGFNVDANGDEDYTDAGDLAQTRNHNDVNEIYDATDAIDQASGQVAWVDPTYDAAGNMTKRPDPTDPGTSTSAQLMTYDAWNRLVKITDNDTPTTIAEYEYDGLGRRIEKRVTGGSDYDYYYNESWQAVEVRKDGSSNPLEQIVYDTAYIDAPVMRWYDSDLDGTADEQFYLYDASFNVIALLNASGAAIERYRYTPYGKRIVMNASFVDQSGTSYGQQRGFQGLLHDTESGLIENRARMLDPLTGRFLQRDPLWYPDGMNTYAAYHVIWGGVDPMGTSAMTPGAGDVWEPRLVSGDWYSNNIEVETFFGAYSGFRHSIEVEVGHVSMYQESRVYSWAHRGLWGRWGTAKAYLYTKIKCDNEGNITHSSTGSSSNQVSISRAAIHNIASNPDPRTLKIVTAASGASRADGGPTVGLKAPVTPGVDATVAVSWPDAAYENTEQTGTMIWKCVCLNAPKEKDPYPESWGPNHPGRR